MQRNLLRTASLAPRDRAVRARRAPFAARPAAHAAPSHPFSPPVPSLPSSFSPPSCLPPRRRALRMAADLATLVSENSSIFAAGALVL